MRKCCVCWYEPVRVRPVRRRCCRNEIEGLSLQMVRSEEENLPTGCPIIFDEILMKNSRDICCHEHEGVIEIRKCGSYMIDWDVMIAESEEDCVSFALEIDGQVQTRSTLPTKAGQLVGRALIQAEQIPTCIRLINDTGCDVKLSRFSPIANLRIVTVD